MNAPQVPSATFTTWECTLVQRISDRPNIGMAISDDRGDYWRESTSEYFCLGLVSFRESLAVHPQHNATRLGDGKGRLGTLTDPTALFLSHRGVHMEHEPIGCWQVDGKKVYTRFHQPRYEVDVAGETVELRDHQLALDPLRLLNGLIEAGPVIALSRFNLGELSDQYPSLNGDKLSD